jgi:hypothetical protein
MSFEQLRELARASAETTLHRLRTEIAAIEATFPELSTSKGRARIVVVTKRKARTMSAAARRAVGERMRKYWAARKAAEKKK